MELNNEQILEYAATKHSTETTTTESNAEMAADTSATPEDTSSTEMVENNAETADLKQPENVPVTDYSKILEELTEGEVKDVDTFKTLFPKAKNYDTLLSEKSELEEKLKVDPFANEYSKTIDSMIRNGKSFEEIENFHKLSKVDIDALSPIEAKIMVMVSKGFDPEIAKEIVEEEYPLHNYDEGSSDRRKLEEKLRVNQEEDKKVLRDIKKDLTAVDNSPAEKAEADRLQAIANQKQFENIIKEAAPTLAQKFTGLGERNLNGKEGDDALKLNFDYSDEFKAELPAKIESFFVDGQMELNETNIQLAEKYARADYLERNFDSILQSAVKHAISVTEEKVINRYENRSGLPAETAPPTTGNNVQREQADFLTRIANGR